MQNDGMTLILENDYILKYKCPSCGAGEIVIDKRSKHQYGYCDTCAAAYIHYIPLPHQLDVHKSKAPLKLLIGG